MLITLVSGRSFPGRFYGSHEMAANDLRTRPRKTAELVAERMVDEILDRDLMPGDRLPPEHELLSRYGVGRNTLREALRILEMQDVLEIRQGPRGGPVVSRTGSRMLASNMALLLAVDRTPFRAILEVRHTIEPTLAADSALHRGDPGKLAELEGTIDALEANLTDQSHVVLENRRFHQLIAERAGNPVFVHLVVALDWIIDGSAIGVRFPEAEVAATVLAHRRIFEAIAAHDPQRAAIEMERHLDEFIRFVERHYPSALDEPIRWRSSSNP